jgi:uncharacterized repeat protein (TIGR01451 family)
VAVSIGAGVLLPAGSALAFTVEKVSLGPGVNVGVHEPGSVFGGAVDAPDREVGVYNIRIFGGAPGDIATQPQVPGGVATRPAFAVDDVTHITPNAPYSNASFVDQREPDAFAGEFGPAVQNALRWLLLHTDRLLAEVPAGDARNRRAAAIQLAVWQVLRNPPLLEPRTDLLAPTNDAALNADAAAIRAQAEAAVAPPLTVTTPVVGGPAPACGVQTATLTITGTPGALVLLQVSEGGTLSASSVTLGADGTAQVTVTGPVSGSVTVTATAQGGSLVRLDPRAGEPDPGLGLPEWVKQIPEELVILAGTASPPASGQVAFAPCTPPPPPPPPGDTPPGGTPPGTSLTPSGSPGSPSATDPAALATASGARARRAAANRPRLAIVKDGPSRAVAGQVISYRIRVRNVGRSTARAVVVRDALPAGFAVASPRVRFAGGGPVWRLGDLRPGASRTIALQVRVPTNAAGLRRNVASAASANAATVRDDALTRIDPVAARVTPAVTG